MTQKCSELGNKTLCKNCGDDVFCIDTNRIYDSSRCRDCNEDVRLYLTNDSISKLENMKNIKVCECRVIWANIESDELPYNKGYYQINVTYYIYVLLSGNNGGCCEELEGVAICEKTQVLYGGEGNVSVFTSEPKDGCCCTSSINDTIAGTKNPKIVLEVATPMALGIKVDNCQNGCDCNVEIPEQICSLFESGINTNCPYPKIYVSIGIFALIRIERPCQLIIPACDFCIPDTDKTPVEINDPCSLFCSSPFPVSEFYPDSNPEC